MKAFLILFVLYCSTFVTGHEEPPNPSGIELAEDLLKSMTSAEELLDLICSCRESAKTDESKLSSVDVTPRPIDCLDVNELGYTTSGRYNIYPSSRGITDVPVEVWCDMDDAEGGWMVIQRREDGSVNFNGTWDDYQRGFGYAGGEFWIGNDNLNHITNQKSYELRTELELWNGTQIVRDFDHFRIGDETSKYQLVINSGIPQDDSSPGLLGMENGRIQDNKITASTIHSSRHVAVNARLNHSAVSGGAYGAWCTLSNDVDEWIQVAFGSPHDITGVITQGRQDSDQWVTKFKMQYSDDGDLWAYIKDGDDQDEVFAGNSDRNTPVTNLFNTPVTARFIRIQPTEWHDHICLRFEVLGCGVYNIWNDMHYQPFSTKNTDNDGVGGSNCAATGGAWWYGDVCSQGGLNGEYMKGTGPDNKGIIWVDMGSTYRVKRSKIKIRPVNV